MLAFKFIQHWPFWDRRASWEMTNTVIKLNDTEIYWAVLNRNNKPGQCRHPTSAQPSLEPRVTTPDNTLILPWAPDLWLHLNSPPSPSLENLVHKIINNPGLGGNIQSSLSKELSEKAAILFWFLRSWEQYIYLVTIIKYMVLQKLVRMKQPSA